MGADRPGIGPGRRLERPQPAGPPRPQPPVDRAPRILAGRPIRVGMSAGVWPGMSEALPSRFMTQHLAEEVAYARQDE